MGCSLLIRFQITVIHLYFFFSLKKDRRKEVNRRVVLNCLCFLNKNKCREILRSRKRRNGRCTSINLVRTNNFFIINFLRTLTIVFICNVLTISSFILRQHKFYIDNISYGSIPRKRLIKQTK